LRQIKYPGGFFARNRPPRNVGNARSHFCFHWSLLSSCSIARCEFRQSCGQQIWTNTRKHDTTGAAVLGLLPLRVGFQSGPHHEEKQMYAAVKHFNKVRRPL
jgi:hypothetical protein